jgi:fluoride ion exporter CrcB/FEX
METMTVNYWAVLVAAVVYMILGALWYSPALFGKIWMKGIGKTKEQVKADAWAGNYIIAIVGSFLACYGIARLMIMTGRTDISDGVTIAVLVGVCFMMTTFSINDTFERRPAGLTLINILYHLVGFIVAGFIIGIWR